MLHTKIAGVGHYVPERIITNYDLEKMIDTSHEWIVERSGIVERRWYEHGKDTVANMGTKAAKIALERAKMTAEDIDFIIFATLTADNVFPGAGVSVQEELGIKEIGALDIRQQCTGFVYGISIADQFIKTGMYKNILVIGSEIHSNALDISDRGRTTAVLFGDGAGAAVLTATEENGKGILSTHLHSEGKYKAMLWMREPGTSHEKRWYEGIEKDYDGIYPYMNGNVVFKHAITRMTECAIESLVANGLTIKDLDLLVAHQANLRISQMVQRQLKLSDSQIYNNIQNYGNTTAATIPIALSELWEQGRPKENDLVCLVAFGSGFTWASALIRW